MSIDNWLRFMMPEGSNGDGTFWPLVGRMSVVFGLPLAVPILAAFYWLGTLSTRVDGAEKQASSLLTVVSGLVTLGASNQERLQTDGEEIKRLRDQVDQLVRVSIAAPVRPGK